MVLAQIGISPSEAINVFYRRIVSDNGIPFSLNIPNAETRKAIRDIREGKNLRTFNTFEDFTKHMRSL